VDPATLTPAMRRDPDELEGFLEILVAEIAHPGLAATGRAGVAARAVAAHVRAASADAGLPACPGRPGEHHSCAGALLEHTVGVATLCRETAQLHPRLRGDLLLAAALLHHVRRVRSRCHCAV